jgi:hypothetical protein
VRSEAQIQSPRSAQRKQDQSGQQKAIEHRRRGLYVPELKSDGDPGRAPDRDTHQEQRQIGQRRIPKFARRGSSHLMLARPNRNARLYPPNRCRPAVCCSRFTGSAWPRSMATSEVDHSCQSDCRQTTLHRLICSPLVTVKPDPWSFRHGCYALQASMAHGEITS